MENNQFSFHKRRTKKFCSLKCYNPLFYVEGDIAAKHLYENFGFYEIDKDEDEIIMQKDMEKDL